MKKLVKTNSTALHIWITENGGPAARKLICDKAGINISTLSRILAGHMPKFEARYLIYKLTSIKLRDEDDFPELIAKSSAS